MHKLVREGASLAPPGARLHRIALLVSLCFAGPAFSQTSGDIRFDTLSDFGGVGLLQMPTARMSPDGEFSFSTGRAAPYFRNAVTMQPVPWAEGVLRYTTIQNRDYGPVEFSGDQRYKDRGLDVKFRLVEESSSLPQIAIGLRDVGGTGLFSSEYIAVSRRYYDFDFTLGLGWGKMGTRGQIPNPLGFLSDRFKTRANVVGQGGNLSLQYFHGDRTSIFGGISYRTPIPGLTIKLELDGNDYQSEGLSNNQKTLSPINLGLTYNHNDWLNLSLGFERGNTLMVQLALRSNFHKAAGMPKYDVLPEKIKPRNLIAEIAKANHPITPAQAQEFADRAITALEKSDFKVDSVALDKKEATALISQQTFRATPKALGRAARLLANEAPATVEELTLASVENGLEVHRVTLLRKDLENAERAASSPEEIAAHTRIEGPGRDGSSKEIHNPDRYPDFSWSWSPAMRHHIGGPDNPYFYQIFLRLDGELQLARGLSVSGGFGFDINNNFSELKLPSDSRLPHVRSDIKQYLKEGKNGITRLEMDYLTNLGPSWYGRLSAGLFEEMFGGAGGELLYKPFAKPWAIGVDINRVRQRDFDERLTFRDYRITTGHLDFYYQLPFYNLLANISVGRYLAGDQGVTVGLSRAFDSGASIGFFATKTNVSAAQFGEGSFDKGFFISIPVDLLSLYSSRSSIGMGWRPLTRDGGQRLGVGKRLYPSVAGSDRNALMKDWSHLLD